MDTVIPEVQTVYASVDGVERREIGNPLVSRAGEMDGVLASRSVISHEPNRDSPHDR